MRKFMRNILIMIKNIKTKNIFMLRKGLKRKGIVKKEKMIIMNMKKKVHTEEKILRLNMYILEEIAKEMKSSRKKYHFHQEKNSLERKK